MKKRLLLQLTLILFITSGSLHVFGQLSGYYQEDFEGTFPPNNWQVVDVLDPTQTWLPSTTYAYSGMNSAYLEWSPMFTQGEDWMILPQFTVSANDSFSFWLAVGAIPYPPDSTYILVSTTDSSLSGFTDELGVLFEDPLNGTYPHVTGTFQYYSFSLAAYAGQNIYVAFKNRNIYGDGVYIDLVTIGSAPPVLSVAAVSVDVPDSVSLNTFSPMGTVINKSDTTQTFPVTMTISDGYSSTMNVTNLAPGAIQQITFDPWIPVSGSETITMIAQLATDTIPSDDTISKFVEAIDTDVALASIDVPVYVSTLSSIIPRATVKNYSLTVESFSVTMNITGGYSSTKSVSNLAPGTREQIDFDVWTPVESSYTVSVQTQLGTDAIPGDDTLSKTVTATPPLSGFYQEEFEGTFPPFGWQTLDVLGPDNVWMQSQDYVFSGSNSAHIHYEAEEGEDWLILPQFTVASTDSLSFWLALDYTSFEDSTYILVSATDAYPSSFTADLTTLWDGYNYPDAEDEFKYYAYSLSAFAGQNIYVALKNRNNNGDGVYIDHLSIGTPLGTGITQSAAVNNDLSSFPNPFSKFTSVSFSLDHSSTVKISIVDVMGKEVATLCDKTLPAGAQQITWNASGYSAGVYFCKVNVNGNITTQKLVKLN